jgi:hypothetical protein
MFCNLLLGLPGVLFASAFQTKNLYEFLISLMCATFASHLIGHEPGTLTLDERCLSLSSSEHNTLQPSPTITVSPKILITTPQSNTFHVLHAPRPPPRPQPIKLPTTSGTQCSPPSPYDSVAVWLPTWADFGRCCRQPDSQG